MTKTKTPKPVRVVNGLEIWKAEGCYEIRRRSDVKSGERGPLLLTRPTKQQALFWARTH